MTRPATHRPKHVVLSRRKIERAQKLLDTQT